MRITKRQLKRIIKEEKSKLQEYYGSDVMDVPDSPLRNDLVVVEDLLVALKDKLAERKLWDLSKDVTNIQRALEKLQGYE